MSNKAKQITIDEGVSLHRIEIRQTEDRRIVIEVSDKGLNITAYYLGDEKLAVFPCVSNSVALVAVPEDCKLI